MLPPPRVKSAPRRHIGRLDPEGPDLGSLVTGVAIFLLASAGALYFVAQAAH